MLPWGWVVKHPIIQFGARAVVCEAKLEASDGWDLSQKTHLDKKAPGGSSTLVTDQHLWPN